MAISGEEKIIIVGMIGFIGWALLQKKDTKLAQKHAELSYEAELKQLELRLRSYKKSFDRLMRRHSGETSLANPRPTRTDFEDLIDDVADIKDRRQKLGGDMNTFLVDCITLIHRGNQMIDGIMEERRREKDVTERTQSAPAQRLPNVAEDNAKDEASLKALKDIFNSDHTVDLSTLTHVAERYKSGRTWRKRTGSALTKIKMENVRIEQRIKAQKRHDEEQRFIASVKQSQYKVSKDVFTDKARGSSDLASGFESIEARKGEEVDELTISQDAEHPKQGDTVRPLPPKKQKIEQADLLSDNAVGNPDSIGKIGLREKEKFESAKEPVNDNVDKSNGEEVDTPMIDLTEPQEVAKLEEMDNGEQAFDSAPAPAGFRDRADSKSDIYDPPRELVTWNMPDYEGRKKMMKAMNRLHEEFNAIDFTPKNRTEVNIRKSTFEEMLQKILLYENRLKITGTEQERYSFYKGLDSQHQNAYREAYGLKKRSAQLQRDQAAKVRKTLGTPIPHNVHQGAYLDASKVHGTVPAPTKPVIPESPAVIAEKKRSGLAVLRRDTRAPKRVKPTGQLETLTTDNAIIIPTRADGGQ